MTPQPTINTFKVFKSKRLRKLAQEENPQACRGFKKRVVMIVRLLSFLRLVAACFAASPYIIYIYIDSIGVYLFLSCKISPLTLHTPLPNSSHSSPSTWPSHIHLTHHPPHTPPTSHSSPSTHPSHIRSPLLFPADTGRVSM